MKRLVVLFSVLLAISTALFSLSLVSFSSTAVEQERTATTNFSDLEIGVLPSREKQSLAVSSTDLLGGFLSVEKFSSSTLTGRVVEVKQDTGESKYLLITNSDSATDAYVHVNFYLGEGLETGKEYTLSVTYKLTDGYVNTRTSNIQNGVLVRNAGGFGDVPLFDTNGNVKGTTIDGWTTYSTTVTSSSPVDKVILLVYSNADANGNATGIALKSISITQLVETNDNIETEVDTVFNLSDYTIVYAKYEAEDLMLSNSSIANLTDWDFNRLIAEELKANIKNAFNVDLPIVKDSNSTPVDKEILIGNTNRKDYQGYLELSFVRDAKIVDGVNTNYAFSATDPFKYAYGLQGNDIYMVGGCYATTYEATNLFFNYLKENLVDNKVDLTASWKVEGTKDLEVIGCIGDSITQGYKSTSADTGGTTTYCYFAYPSYLQRLNWKTAYVYNLGKSGRTMLTTLANSYQETARWTEAQKVKDVLDYVIIALGTNDSKLVLDNEARAWTTADSEQFVEDFFKIVETLTENNKDIKFIFSNCPKNYSSANYAKDFILDLQAQCVTEAKKEGYTIELFDMNTYSTQNMPSSTHYYSDKLHPNTVGYHEMAKGINGALEDIGLNDTPDTPNTPDTPDTPVDDDKGGCGSVITVGSALLSVVLLGGAVVMLKKKD